MKIELQNQWVETTYWNSSWWNGERAKLDVWMCQRDRCRFSMGSIYAIYFDKKRKRQRVKMWVSTHTTNRCMYKIHTSLCNRIKSIALSFIVTVTKAFIPLSILHHVFSSAVKSIAARMWESEYDIHKKRKRKR